MNPNQPQTTKINVLQLAEKCRSKKELYTFLTHDGHAYLPKIESTNVYFFRQIMSGKKEYIKRDLVKVSAVPQIEGLTVVNFLEYAKAHPGLLTFLPDPRDWVHIDKKWVCDVLYTLDPSGIQSMINECMETRKIKVELSKHLNVNMRPEFAQALANCQSFSSSKGKSADLMKEQSKRKRTRQEMEEVREFEDSLKDDRQQFLQKAKRLKHENDMLQQQVIQLNQSQQTIQQLYNQGIIDEAGNPIIPSSQDGGINDIFNQ